MAGAITDDPDPAVGFNGSASEVSLPALGSVGDVINIPSAQPSDVIDSGPTGTPSPSG